MALGHMMIEATSQERREGDLLMSNENLEGRNELGKRHALVLQPLLVGGLVVDNDYEIVIGALVVELALGAFAAGHDC